MSEFLADPLSRMDIRRMTTEIRRSFDLQNQLYFPVLHALEIFPIIDETFFYEVVEDDQLPHDTHAEYSVENNCIRIKNSVYIGAYNGFGRDRMTVAHEIGHYILIRQHGIKLSRSFGNTIETCRDPEWQAKCFGGELLIPACLVKGMAPYQVAVKCGVSLDAAAYQLTKIK